ncbi:DUF2177 family protein [Novosphingobium sp. 9]|uniref:DUF2177 family protein n=1 Tax=Novosphingobium sp. 9 TaxID=2025349 RepID=UPI0021B68EBA|nr:DUF2177 family protein [Novosphingobium sp. 9]
MKAWIGSYLVTGLVFLAFDVVWLSLTASRLYKPELHGLLRDGFSVVPAAAFYLIYIAGILVLAVWPALAADRLFGAVMRGAVLGLVAYATYDLTNQSTLRGWSGLVTGADLCWGTLLTGVAAGAGFLAMRWITAHG